MGDASLLRNDVTVRSGNPRTREHKAKRMEVRGGQPARGQSAGRWGALAEQGEAGSSPGRHPCPASAEVSGAIAEALDKADASMGHFDSPLTTRTHVQ